MANPLSNISIQYGKSSDIFLLLKFTVLNGWIVGLDEAIVPEDEDVNDYIVPDFSEIELSLLNIET